MIPAAEAHDDARGLVPPTRPEGFGPPDALRTIVTRPRATMRWLLDHGDGGLWTWLLAGAVLAGALPLATSPESPFVRLPTLASSPWLRFALVIVAGVLGQFAFAAGATLAARPLGGVGRWGESLRALAWGELPVVAALPFSLVLVFLGGARESILVTVLGWFVAGAGLGSSALTVFTLAEAHRFAWWRGLLALSLTLLALTIVGVFAALFVVILLQAVRGAS